METTLFLGAGASMFAEMPTTRELVADVLRRVYHHEKWDSPAAHHLAKNIVHKHGDKDVEVLYKTIQTMISAEESHKTVVENKTTGDSGGRAASREITAGSKSTSDTDDIDENIRTL